MEWVVLADWEVGTGEPNGFKSVTAFYPDEASTSNGIVSWTHLLLACSCLQIAERACFSYCSNHGAWSGLHKNGIFWESWRLCWDLGGCFFAIQRNWMLINLHSLNCFKQVSGLDRSWQRPPGVAAKLIDCKASNGNIYIYIQPSIVQCNIAMLALQRWQCSSNCCAVLHCRV